MDVTLISSLIAPLFVPADRPDRFAKAAASGAGAVIIDLEDAVPADRKTYAREQLRGVDLNVPVIVRVNGATTPWHADDCAALRGLTISAVMLPKVERAEDCALLDGIAPIIALVETARGLDQARLLAQSGVYARLAFGSVDYTADVGCDHIPDALLLARCELVLASRLGNLPPPLDGVTVDVTEAATAGQDARAARSLGFGGKLIIHPRQIGPVYEGFKPGPDEIAWAHRVLSGSDGAVKVDGMMVDEPVRIRARAILSRGGATVNPPP
jgi:citrate lyase subunit beta/citryl-CoA lyase